MIAASCTVCGRRIPGGTSRCDDHARTRYGIASSCVVCGISSHFLYCDDHRPPVKESTRAEYRKGYRDPAYYRERQGCLNRAKGRCERCGKPGKLEVDHIVPLRDGGTNTRSNLQALCSTCHNAKTQEDRRRRRDR